MNRAYGTQPIINVFFTGLKSGITKWFEPTALLLRSIASAHFVTMDFSPLDK